jgi:hypothetical protein
MPNKNGTQTVEPDEKLVINPVDDKSGSPSKKSTPNPQQAGARKSS